MGQPVRLLADYLTRGLSVAPPQGDRVAREGGGHPNGIGSQITNRTKTVKTKTGRKRDAPVVERLTLTDDLDGAMECFIVIVEIASA